MIHENFYENRGEAEHRLLGSVVLYDGKPVIVEQVSDHSDGTVRLHIRDLPDPMMEGKTSRKMCNSPKFNRFRPFPIGYVNFLTGSDTIQVHYVERIPARTRVQGLTPGATSIQAANSRYQDSVNYTALIHNEGFVEAVQGIYPTFAEYLAADQADCALHRDVCVTRSSRTNLISVEYKNQVVGVVTEKSKLMLFPKFKYLMPVFTEMGLFETVVPNLFD